MTARANCLYYGDNLDVLREHIDTESVDLIYLDPPFNSNRGYNVIFARRDIVEDPHSAQIHAFDDTWRWTPVTEQQFEEAVSGGLPNEVADALTAFRTLLGENDAMAYLVNMAPRLVEMRRVLKPTGSLYLHCDPTMSHYLKLTLDAVFGPECFRNEIIWRRSSAHSDSRQGSKHFGRLHDVIFLYTKGAAYTFHEQYNDYGPAYVQSKYPHIELGTRRRYGLWDMTGPGGAAKGNPSYEVMGVTRFWRYSQERMNALINEGRVVQPRPGAVPRFKRYLDESPGIPLQDVWADIDPINSQAKERLGYQTQKPVALLKRIMAVSSNEGDVVLDPFCGCGTTIDAAVQMDRRWIGIDVTFIAVDLIEERLVTTHGPSILETYDTDGIPRDIGGAQALFGRSPFEFERWAVSLVRGTPNLKQVGDKGSDGVIRFPTAAKGAIGRVIVSVKGGKGVMPAFVTELLGAVETHKAQMGVLITMAEPTPGMIYAADHGGTYVWPVTEQRFPRIQLATVSGLLAGRKPDLPPAMNPYIAATRHTRLVEQLVMGAD